MTTESVKSRQLMDANGIEEALDSLADSITQGSHGTDGLAMVGIRRRGVPIATRVTERLRKKLDTEVIEGVLDITLYRDDLSQVASQPVVSGSQIGFDVSDKRVVLCDDVLFTGRTVRAALNAICEFGRPRTIELAVLVDRGHRELPIHADHAALVLETTLQEVVKVHLKEVDGDDCAEILPLDQPAR